MTLDTKIAVQSPITWDEILELFHHCQNLLGCDETTEWGHEDKDYYPAKTIANQIAQGLPAWLRLHHNDGELLPMDHEYPDPVAYVTINFDTGYSYDHNGASCSDLHAWLIREIGEWLSDRGMRCLWHNEFEGTWHANWREPSLGDPEKGALHERADNEDA